jgi:hypothetical protein
MEVLAAIFITAIGLLSLLVLFPVGALSMARAINDDRAAQAGENGRAIADAVNMRLDPQIQGAMLNSNGAFANTPSADGPGYLVLVDPIGVQAFAGQGVAGQTNWQNWVGGYLPNPTAPPPGNTVPSFIQRGVGNWLTNPLGGPPATADIIKWCTLTDDIGFQSDVPYQGLASSPPAWVNPAAASVLRNIKFTYAWLFRMPRAGSPNVVDVSTLVFNGRVPDQLGFGAPSDQEMVIGNVTFVPTQNQLVLPLPAAGQTNPDLRAGQWILDATIAPNPNAGSPTSLAGFFYRVVTVVEDPVTGQMTIEVQTPLRGWPQAGGIGTIVVFDKLLEVFDSGTF